MDEMNTQEAPGATVPAPSPVTGGGGNSKQILKVALLVFVVLMVAAGVWYWQSQKANELQTQVTALEAEKVTLQTKVSELEAEHAGGEMDEETDEAPAVETDKQQVQRVATAYLNRLKEGKDSDEPDFEAKETTTIDGRFAVQLVCGGNECYEVRLKKVGDTWGILGADMSFNETTFRNEYGWPANFGE